MGIEKYIKGNSKINDRIKKSLYNRIMHHPQVVQSPIVNDCLKFDIDGHTEPQLVKNYYCRYPLENFITDLLVTHKMVDSKRQYMKK